MAWARQAPAGRASSRRRHLRFHMRSLSLPGRSLAGRPTSVLVMATGLLAATAAYQTVPGVLGPLLETDLGINQAALGLLSAALIGGMAIGLLPGGVLSDRFSERTIMTIGVGGGGLAMSAASWPRQVVRSRCRRPRRAPSRISRSTCTRHWACPQPLPLCFSPSP